MFFKLDGLPNPYLLRLGELPHRLEVSLGQELVVEHAVDKVESVPLLLPEVDLVDHGGRDEVVQVGGRLGGGGGGPLAGGGRVGGGAGRVRLLLLGVGVHTKEAHDLPNSNKK